MLSRKKNRKWGHEVTDWLIVRKNTLRKNRFVFIEDEEKEISNVVFLFRQANGFFNLLNVRIADLLLPSSGFRLRNQFVIIDIFWAALNIYTNMKLFFFAANNELWEGREEFNAVKLQLYNEENCFLNGKINLRFFRFLQVWRRPRFCLRRLLRRLDFCPPSLQQQQQQPFDERDNRADDVWPTTTTTAAAATRNDTWSYDILWDDDWWCDKDWVDNCKGRHFSSGTIHLLHVVAADGGLLAGKLLCKYICHSSLRVQKPRGQFHQCSTGSF